MQSKAVELLVDVIKADPQGSEKAHHDEMKARKDVCDNEIFDYWFKNIYRSLHIQASPSSVTVMRNAVTRQRINKTVEKVVRDTAQVLLMNLTLSNGKKLRESTFAECKREGGWLSLVAKQGKPSEVVGKKLTEKHLANIRLRSWA